MQNNLLNADSVMIRVPASSANIGCGFDCFGLALNLHSYYRISRSEVGKQIIWQGEILVNDGENLVANTIEKLLAEAGNSELGYVLEMLDQNIPVSRGLGSSAAAIIAGIMAADWLLKREYDRDRALKISTDIEGHPDNVSAAIYGNFCLSKIVDNQVISSNISFPKEIRCLLMYPDFKLSTAHARSVLPQEYSLADVVSNISGAGFLIASLYTQDWALFSRSLDDKLHFPYRLKLIDGGEKLISLLAKLGGDKSLGTTISGAGSAMISFFKEDVNLDAILNECRENFNKWTFLELEVDRRGAIYE